MSDLAVIEQPRRTTAIRLTIVGESPVVCPAGIPVGETAAGSGCRCTVEQKTLTTRFDPNSLGTYCFDRYDLCPSWQDQRNWEDEGWRAAQMVEQRERQDAREAMERYGMVEGDGTAAEISYFEHPEIDET